MRRRTSKGKLIDFDEIISQQNATTTALGNMGVNARGDKLGPGGQIVQDSTQRVRAYYRDNPKSSTHYTSLKEPLEDTAKPTQVRSPVVPDVDSTEVPETPANVDVAVSEPVVPEPEEFDSPEPPKPKRTARKKKSEPVQENTTVEVNLPEFNMEEQTTKIVEEVADIEVETPDGDIVMMTGSQYEEYLNSQSGDASA